jgi:general secretion pathway protein K
MRRETSSGYALVLVLVGLAILSLLAGSVLVISNNAVRRVSEAAERAQLAAAAQAGMNAAVLSLMAPPAARFWSVDGTPRAISFDGVAVTVSVADEAGKIDLNGDARPLIFGLFEAAGLDRTAADMMADRVLDWREPGDLKRLNGAKAADYRAAGLPYAPRGGPFRSIGELNLVMGMTPELYRQLEPGVTVYSVFPIPQLQSAPAIILRATGMDSASIEAVLAARAKGQVAPAPFALAPQQSILGLPGTVFTITAQARMASVLVDRAETIRFTGDPQNPFWVLAWK